MAAFFMPYLNESKKWLSDFSIPLSAFATDIKNSEYCFRRFLRFILGLSFY